MTQKELETLQALSNKREKEELTREEKQLYKTLLELWNDNENAQYIKNRRAEV